MNPLQRTTYANVASTLALALVVGGGTAYAAGLVGTDDIAPKAVTAPKLHKNAVTRLKIAGDAVNTNKVADGSLRLVDVAWWDKPLVRVRARSTSFTFGPEDTAGVVKEGTAMCPGGETLVSGGHDLSTTTHDTLLASRPEVAGGGPPPQGDPADGWYVRARQAVDGRITTVTVWALCAS